MEVLNCFINWSNFIGLILSFIGALFLVYGLIVSEENAIELGVTRLSGETDNENLQLPLVQNFIIQSRNAKIGIILVTLGFLFQIFGSWPKNNK